MTVLRRVGMNLCWTRPLSRCCAAPGRRIPKPEAVSSIARPLRGRVTSYYTRLALRSFTYPERTPLLIRVQPATISPSPSLHARRFSSQPQNDTTSEKTKKNYSRVGKVLKYGALGVAAVAVVYGLTLMTNQIEKGPNAGYRYLRQNGKLKLAAKQLELDPEALEEIWDIDGTRQLFQGLYNQAKAGKWDRVDFVQRLLKGINSPNSNGLLSLVNPDDEMNLFLKFVAEGNENAVSAMLDRYEDHEDLLWSKTGQGMNALHLAISKGHEALVPHLLPFFNGDETTRSNETPLQLAADCGHTRILHLLLKQKPSLKTEVPKQLDRALEKGLMNALALFLSVADSPNRESFFNKSLLLHQAVFSGSEDLVNYLVKEWHAEIKDHLETKDANGCTPLHLAAISSNSKMAQLLIQAGSDVNAVDNLGSTPLHAAALAKSRAVIGTLLASGKVDINKANNMGMRAVAFVQDATLKATHCRHLLTDAAEQEKLLVRSKPDFKVLPPENLVFQGGGAKGVAFIGSFGELEKQNLDRDLKRVAGTSAGAIMASLVATGHKTAEIDASLGTINLADFFDFENDADKELVNRLREEKSWYAKAFTAIKEGVFNYKEHSERIYKLGGYCKGDKLREWLDDQYKGVTGKRWCTFKELKEASERDPRFKDLHVYVANPDPAAPYSERIIRISAETHPDYIVSHAVMASAAIPVVFKPQQLHVKQKDPIDPAKEVSLAIGPKLVDGGVFKNFALDAFDHQKYQSGEPLWAAMTNRRTLGMSFKVENGAPAADGADLKATLLSIVMDYYNIQDILNVQHAHDRDRTVHLDTHGVGTFDAKLTPEQKQGVKEASANSLRAFLNPPPAAG